LRIVIAGAGRIGRHLAKSMSARHEVVVIEADEKRSKALSSETDALVIRGDATRIETFHDAEVDKADVFVALTDHDETNLLACLLAKEMGVPRLIARISDPGLANTFERLGIEEAICPETIAANLIEGAISGYHMVARILSSKAGEAVLLTVTVEGGSRADGKKLGELEIPKASSVIAIYKGDSLEFPNGNTELSEGQKVLLLAPARDADKLKSIFLK
jgi:trk system potassium uptake protein TrkA